MVRKIIPFDAAFWNCFPASAKDVAHVYGSLAKSCPQLGRLLLSVLAAIFFDSSGQFRLALARHLEEGTVTCKHSAVDNLLTLAYCPSSRDASGTVCRTVLDSEASKMDT